MLKMFQERTFHVNWITFLVAKSSVFDGSVGAHQTQSGGGIRVNYPTRKKFLLVSIFHYFANDKFAKFKFSLLLLPFQESLNNSLYYWNSRIKIH